MWKIKIKLKHNCTIGNRCEKFKCKSYSLTLSNWLENNNYYTSQRHNLIGNTENITNFIEDLKKEKRIHNLKVFNNDVFFIEKRSEKEIPSSFYKDDLIIVHPVKVDEFGFEEWDLASQFKEKLEDFYKGLEKTKEVSYIEIISLKKKNNINILENPFKKKSITNRLAGFMDSKLGIEKIVGNVEGEQWFRDFQDWLFIAFNNPYNRKYPNSELRFLEKNQKEIYPYLKENTLIFYGAGVGETELEIVRQKLEKDKICEVVAIDVNPSFINLLRENLKNKVIEYPQSEIVFKGYVSLFQNMTKDDFNFQNSKNSTNIHICVGGTIGNFKDQDEIAMIFKNNTKKGDLLFLAFQLDKNLEEIFKKYEQNIYFPQFVLNYEDKIETKKIKWLLDKENSTIKMLYKNREVFRSKKYSIETLNEILEKYDFILEKKWIDEYENTGLAVYKRI